MLDKYDLKLDREFLEDPEVDLWDNVGLPEFGQKGVRPQEVVLDDLRGLLDRLENYVVKEKEKKTRAEHAADLLEAAV